MQEKWREKSHEAVWVGHSRLERELAKGYMSHQPVKAGHNQPAKNIFAICQHKHREFYNYRKLIIAQKI